MQITHRAVGAQLLQAVPGALDGATEPLFYLSPLLSANAPARGGVPVLFPQFADSGPLPKHGMVRNALWQADGEAAYTLHIAATDYPAWPHACRLRLAWQASPDALRVTLAVTNTGHTPFGWTGGLHPYFAVGDVQRCRLTGLAGLAVQDRYDAAASQQDERALTWTQQACERLYASAPPLQLSDGQRTVHLTASGFDQWMVWNPGKEGAQALADLPHADWSRFVCVEPVCVERPVVLAAGEVFTGWLEATVESA